jgi:EmrB/QacA subfamily drug resistance transporter
VGHATTALLAVVCMGQFMVILDLSVVNIALPEIRAGLHFSTTGLQWVVNAYTLTFAGLLLLGGRAADLLGRRRVFLAGTAFFVLTSLACALAQSRGQLICARGAQGIAGAITSPATLSIITSALPEGRERNRALSAWGATGALGGSTGVLLGGVLTQAFGWQAIFLLNVPLGLIVIVAGLRVIPVLLQREAVRQFDALGAALITVGLIVFTFGIVNMDQGSWHAAGTLAAIGAGIVLIAAFFYVEARLATNPLIPLSIFRLRRLRIANLVVGITYGASFPGIFFITLYLQEVLHLSVLVSGLCFLPFTLTTFVTATQAARAVARFGAARVIGSGMLSLACGLLLLSGIAPGGSYLSDVLVGGVLQSLGIGLCLVPSTIVAMQDISREQSGAASGVLNTSRLVGSALGLATLSTIAAIHTHDLAHTTSAGRALTDGFDFGFRAGAGLTVIGLAAAICLRASGRRAAGSLPAVVVDLASDAGNAATTCCPDQVP